MPITEWPSYVITKDILTLLLTLAGLVIAGMGLATWKKQIHGSKEFEVGYKLNYSVLKVREAIKFVRNPVIWPGESTKAIEHLREKNPHKTEGELHKNAAPHVYSLRWIRISDALAEMDADLLAAEILWGKEVVRLIKPLYNKITELNINLEQYFNPDLRTQDYMNVHKVVYAHLGDEDKNDTFATEVNQIVEQITKYIKLKIS